MLIGLLCALFILLADSLEFFKGLERQSLDAFFRARGVIYPSPSIVIVEADDSTISRNSWPLPRTIYADLVNHLTDAGAKTIAFDVLFPTTSGSAVADKALIDATARSKRVIHAAVFNFEAAKDPFISVGVRGNASKIEPRFRVPDQDAIVSETVWGSAALPALQRHAVGLGHVNAPPEEDGVLRRVPHLLRFRGGDRPVLYPSLALATAAHFWDVHPKDIRANQQDIILPSPQGPLHIPLDNIGRTWVNWIGPHHSFPTFTFNQVLDGGVPDSEFKDRIVLIGITAAGSFERHATPFTSVQPALELQANALDDILMRRPMQAASTGTFLLLVLLFPALIGAVAMAWNAKISAPVCLLFCGLLWGTAFNSLSRFHLYIPVATALAAGLLSWSACIAFRQYLDAQELRRAEERYALAVRGANDGLWDWDLKANSIYYSPRWKSMLGFAEEEIGHDIHEWHGRVHPEDIESMRAQLEAHLSGGVAHFESRHRMQHKDGRWVWVLSRGLRVSGPDGKALRMAGSQSDISSQVETSEQLERNAFYDTLTGLPNRALFMNVLGRALGRAGRRQEYRFAVLFLDLDRFKNVNDSLGHASGDELLIQVAGRLQACLRPGDIAARLGGDEFTLMLEDIEDVGVATRVAERIQGELTEPLIIDGHEIFTSASIGIALSSRTYENPEELLRDADTAMYRAKSLGRARHAVFDEAMHAQALSQLRLESDMRRALEREDFLVYYQPIVRLESGEISGFEALVRWQHPERGMVSPGEFVPLAEETGLIIPLDHMVLKKACIQVKQWQDQFPNRNLNISVNFSSNQFAQTDLVGQIADTLRATGLPAKSLKMEITEGVLMNSPEAAAAMLHQLRNLGIQLSIDDFGTGYSSLSYLHRFPLDTLKVDQSFVRRMGENGENSEIVHTIVTLARNLHMNVVAEGVETEAQMEQLQAIQCDYGQGYHFARPLNAVDAEALLYKGTTWKSNGKRANSVAVSN